MSEEGRQEVVASDVYARRLGINGVPCFIVNRKYAVSGAQPPSAFVEVFNLAERDAATSTAPVDGLKAGERNPRGLDRSAAARSGGTVVSTSTANLSGLPGLH